MIREAETSKWLSFEAPDGVLAATSASDIRPLLDAVQQAVDTRGCVAAGYVAYEAASAFDPSFCTRPAGDLPLAVFGLFRTVRRFDGLPPPGQAPAHAWQLDTSAVEFARKVGAIREQIELGMCYQVNFTLRLSAQGIEDPWLLFQQVARSARYGAYLETGDHAILSASPELFFSLDGSRIRCRPMKGTARRGMTTQADDAIVAALRASEKNRAENIMIADMVRNDLGRIAHPGSVYAASLYELEKYPTVWQMTSTIEARTDAGLGELFAALFPCASITGAPKTAAMRFIAGLETSPRGIYTGAIGWFAPSRRASFSVAIRTALVDRRSQRGTYGTGGGIVWDSDPADEYRECLAKARVLQTLDVPAHEFELLESLRWTPEEGYFLRQLHLDRMLASARYFDFALERAALEAALDAAVGPAAAALRVRLLAGRTGTVRTETGPLPPPLRAELRLRLATTPVDADNPFLYHKTTQRRVYEAAAAAAPGCDDALLCNRAGCITESTRANVVVRLRGRDYTPPVASGLLGGTYRQWLLEQGELAEREIRVDDLREAEAIQLINSVRGRMPARLVDADAAAIV